MFEFQYLNIQIQIPIFYYINSIPMMPFLLIQDILPASSLFSFLFQDTKQAIFLVSPQRTGAPLGQKLIRN